MTLAKALLKLWTLRLWVALGVVLGAVAAVGSLSVSHSSVYAIASTQMLVDSRSSALVNAGSDLTGYMSRASVYARLMTSNEALQYIGKAAGIAGSEIAATGPIEINGSPTATHAPVEIKDGKDHPAAGNYSITLVQNPDLPTVDVYAEAPTPAQAIALANGSVTGFANFLSHLNSRDVPAAQYVQIRQLGGATGGTVDASASKSMTLLIFLGVFVGWCALVLCMSRLRSNLRAAKRAETDEPVCISEPGPASRDLAPGTEDLLHSPHAAGIPGADAITDASHHTLPTPVQSRNGSNGRDFVRP